ncbi:MAG: hypothetical protein ABIA78_02900 [archaeon]
MRKIIIEELTDELKKSLIEEGAELVIGERMNIITNPEPSLLKSAERKAQEGGFNYIAHRNLGKTSGWFNFCKKEILFYKK